MKKLFNLKSLLLTIALVLVFGAVGAAAAETEYMSDNAVAVGGNYYIKKAGSGATYKSITKEDGKAKDVVAAVDDKTQYFIPSYKVTYDGVKDELTIYAYEGTAKITGKLYIVVSDKAKTSISESDLKKNSKSIETAANGVKVGLSSDLGFATGKDAYVYVVMSPTDPSEKITKPADYLVAQIAKNPEDVSAVAINYYLMDSDNEAASGIIVAKKKTSSGEDTIVEDKLLYKPDAENSVWAPAKYSTDPAQAGFTPKALYTAIGYAAGKKAPKLFVRTAGVSVTAEKTPAEFNALADAAKPIRPGKDKSVSLKLQAKAPNVKFDAKTGTIAIQNGYDYQLQDATATQATIAAYNLNTWTTVLPYNANGTAEATTGTSYVPQDKIILADAEASIAGNQSSYTSTKVKNVDAVNAAAKWWIVRKSATTKAPASESAIIEVPAQKDAPSMVETSSAYAVVDHVVGKAVTFVAPEISNATGDTATAKYEYAIINTGDYATVVWSSVKWTDLKKGTKIKSTAKSKYYTTADVTNASTYGDKLTATEHKAIYTQDVYIVIRRCGETKDSAYIVPSAMLKTVVTYDAGKFTWKKYVAPPAS